MKKVNLPSGGGVMVHNKLGVILLLLAVVTLVWPAPAGWSYCTPDGGTTSGWTDVTIAATHPNLVSLWSNTAPPLTIDGCEATDPESWSFGLRLNNVSGSGDSVEPVILDFTSGQISFFADTADPSPLVTANLAPSDFDNWFGDDPDAFSGGIYDLNDGARKLEPTEYSFGCICGNAGRPIDQGKFTFYFEYDRIIRRNVEYSTSTPPIAGDKDLTPNSAHYFMIDVPTGASNLEFSAYNLTGDIDLYAKHGARPTLADYDQLADTAGTEDPTITVAAPASGWWWVMAYNADTTSTDGTMSFHFDYDCTDYGQATLLEGSLVQGAFTFNETNGYEKAYGLHVPFNSCQLVVTVSFLGSAYSGPGDVELYVQKGSIPVPDTDDYDAMCTIAGGDVNPSGNNECSVQFATPAPNAGGECWYALVRMVNLDGTSTLTGQIEFSTGGLCGYGDTVVLDSGNVTGEMLANGSNYGSNSPPSPTGPPRRNPGDLR